MSRIHNLGWESGTKGVFQLGLMLSPTLVEDDLRVVNDDLEVADDEIFSVLFLVVILRGLLCFLGLGPFIKLAIVGASAPMRGKGDGGPY